VSERHADRRAGLLLHPTSLPGHLPIGDIGPAACAFVDWLAEAGCTLWQILPLCPTGFGNSPYQSHSVFAGNEYLISPELLLRDGLLTHADLREAATEQMPEGGSPWRVDFGHAIAYKLFLLEKAFVRFESSASPAQWNDFARFRRDHAFWLDDYCLYAALKSRQGGAAWNRWPDPLRLRDSTAMERKTRSLAKVVRRYAFGQMCFFHQWAELRRHAARRGIRIVGDVPIFVAGDSADVWAHPELFFLDERRRPLTVAGVPPDYFAPTGQLWGNPMYDWDRHRETQYRWWLERLMAELRRVDMVRLDHFRGFTASWAIPADAPTAERGEWTPGPSDELLDCVMQEIRAAAIQEPQPIIAEDLGVITPDVVRLRNRYGFPGMKVLQFGFAGLDEDFLPHTYDENCVAYTGTHDNDTVRGWFNGASDAERKRALKYLRASDTDVVEEMLRAVWTSKARLAIAPVQDVLDLGGEARMNYPGKPAGNWDWRLERGHLTDKIGRRLLATNTASGRLEAARAGETRKGESSQAA